MKSRSSAVIQQTGLAALAMLLAACAASRQAANRPFRHLDAGLLPRALNAQQEIWESEAKDVRHKTYYLEFDDQGDFWDRHQLVASCKSLEKDARQADVLMIYVHGWKNNSVSGDVARFNRFLNDLAIAINWKASGRMRVLGAYLGWCGESYGSDSYISADPDPATVRVHSIAGLGENAPAGTGPRHARRSGLAKAFWFVPRQVSYPARDASAKRVAGGPMGEAIQALSNTARLANRDIKVILVGHSMGALVIEKTWLQMLSEHVEREGPGHTSLRLHTLADLTFLWNSAAPSQLAKESIDYFRMRRFPDNTVSGERPLIVALQAEDDGATRKVFATLGSPVRRAVTAVVRGAYRSYGTGEAAVSQKEFDTVTTGHNPYLISHRAVRNSAFTAGDQMPKQGLDGTNWKLGENLGRPGEGVPPVLGQRFRVYTRGKEPGRLTWTEYELRRVTTEDGSAPYNRDTPYWIVQLPSDVTSGHGDIWSYNATNVMAALARIAIGTGKTNPLLGSRWEAAVSPELMRPPDPAELKKVKLEPGMR